MNRNQYRDINDSSSEGNQYTTKIVNFKDNSSGEDGELYYFEPNESMDNQQRVIQETSGRASPKPTQLKNSGSSSNMQKSILSTVRNDLGEKSERTTQFVRQPPSFEVSLPKKEGNRERSPMTINMGNTDQDKEYNIKTLNARRGQRETLYNTYTNKNAIEEYQNYSYLPEQKMQPGSYQLNESGNNPNLTMQSTGNIHAGRVQNTSGFIPRDEDESRLSNLRHQMERDTIQQSRENDGQLNSKTFQMNVEGMPGSIPGRDTMNTTEVQKMIKKLTKVYDPTKGNEGALVGMTQTIMPSKQADQFRDRQQVLQKMNRLSTILLSNRDSLTTQHQPEQIKEATKKTFDRKTLAQGKLGEGGLPSTSERLTLARSPKQKFLFTALAMISSKGPNSEDRIILRKMRWDKGGVVDLAQDSGKSKGKYAVKKVKRKGPPTGTKQQRTNPKFREKAAKTVQFWWRDLRDRYKRVYKKIIRIQSTWRGRWIRKYMYDIIYISFLYQSFCQSIQKVLVGHVRPLVFDLLTADKRNLNYYLTKLFEKDMRLRCVRIRSYWNHWRAIVRKYGDRNLKSKKMIKIRNKNDENLNTLIKAFAKYRQMASLMKYVHKSNDEAAQKRKFFGLIKMIQGGEKFAKRQGLRTVKPHIDYYLSLQMKQKAVSIMLHQNPKMKRVLLKNYFNRWREQLRKIKLKDFKNGVFWNLLNKSSTRFSKGILRKYFFKWHRALPKNTDINFFTGSAILQKAVWRKTYQEPLQCLKEKEDLLNTKDAWLRMLGVKSRHIKQNWREYFYKWRLNAQRIKDKEQKNRLYNTLLGTLLTKRRRRILANRFNHWRKVPKIDMAEVFARFHKMIAFTQKVVNGAIKKHRGHFIDELSQKTHPRLYHNAIQIMLERSIVNDRLRLRYVFNKWKEQCHKYEIYDLKMQLLRFAVNKNNFKTRNNRLNKAFNQWRSKINDINRDKQHLKSDALKEKMLKKHYGAKLITNIKGHFGKENNQNTLRCALMKYRSQVNMIINKENNETTKAMKLLIKHNLKTNAPIMLDNMRKIDMKTQKTTALRSMPRKYNKYEKVNLLRYFLKWKNATSYLIQKEINDVMRRRMIKRYCLRQDKELLSKYFNKWKVAGLGKRNNFPLIVGSEKLRQALLNKPWDRFKTRVNMMNLKIPEGMSLQQAILSGKNNFAKSICLRNINLRPYFNRWKEKVEALHNRDLKHEIFNKMIYPKIKNGSKLPLRKALNNWKDQTDAINNNRLQKNLYMKLMERSYHKGSLHGLRRAFNKWHQNYQLYIRKLNNANEACCKLRKAATIDPMNHFRKGIMHQGKYNKVKSMLINHFRSNDKNNLAYSFNKWRKAIEKMKEIDMKTMFLKHVMKHQDTKTNEYKRNRLHAALLKWRIQSSPNNWYKYMNSIVRGTQHVHKAMRGPFNKDILNRLQNLSDDRLKKRTLCKFISAIDPKFDNRLMKKAFEKWRNKLPDTILLKDKLRVLFNKSIISKPMHDKSIGEPVMNLVEAMKAYDLIKQNKAKTISDFCNSLLNIQRQMNLLKRNILLNKLLKEKTTALLLKYPILFNRWKRNARIIKANDDAKIIQDYLRAKRPNRENKLKNCQNGINLLKNHLTRKILDRMSYTGRMNLMTQLQQKVLTNKANADKKSLRDRFNTWKNQLPSLRRIAASTILQNNYRNLKARQQANRYRLRNSKIKLITLRLFDKYVDKKHIAFAKWNNEAERRKCNDNAAFIQQWLDRHHSNYLKSNAKNVLCGLFTKSIVRQIKNIITIASGISSNRAEVLYRTLEDIYIRRPYEKIINALQWKSKVNLIKRIQPKIHKALKNHFLPYYFRQWYKNTVEVRNKKIIQIQQWYRYRMIILRRKAALSRCQLLTKFLARMTDDKSLLLAFHFKLWNKKAQLMTLNDQALNIQKIWKGSTSRKNVDRILNKNNLRKLLRKKVINDLSTTIQDANNCYRIPLNNHLAALSHFDIRYATNNLIDFANDLLRNNYLYLLTGRMAFKDSLSILRLAFNKWRNNGSKLNDAAKKIQNNFRSKKACNKRKYLQHIKDCLLSLVMKYSNDNKSLLGTAFAKWNLRTNMLKCNFNSQLIQDYLRPKLAKLLNRQFTNYFMCNATKIAKHRLNTCAKGSKMNHMIDKVAMGDFFTRFNNKLRCDQLRWFLIKRFNHLDDSIAKLYLQKYFNDWRRNAHLLTEKMLKGIKLIQNNFRQLLAKRFLMRLKEKRAKVLRLLMRIINDNELRKQIAFNLWRTNATAMKLDEASKILQAFLDDINRKKLLRQKALKRKRINAGLNIMNRLKYPLRIGYKAIKAESDKKVFTKAINNLQKVRDDHIRASYDAIRNEEKRRLINKIFKIPPGIRLRILKKSMDKWNYNAKAIARLRGSEMIQRNYRLHSINKRNNALMKHLKSMMSQLNDKYSNILLHYFKKWHKNAQKTKMLRAGNKINHFLKEKMSLCKAKKNWNKFSDGLNIIARNYSALNLLARLKRYIALSKLIKPIDYRLKRDGYDRLMDQLKLIIQLRKMRLIFDNFDKRQDILLLNAYFNRWKNTMRKMVSRDIALNRAVKAMDNRYKCISVSTINSACLIKKLFNVIPKIRALDAFERMRNIAEYNRKLCCLKKLLEQDNQSLYEINQKNSMEKAYKVYIYQILKKFNGRIFDCLCKHKRPTYDKLILHMLGRVSDLTADKYSINHKISNYCPKTSLSFHSRITNPRNTFLNRNKDNDDSRYPRLMPYLVDYLQKKIDNNKQWGMNKLKDEIRDSRFCHFYKSFSKAQLKSPKHDLIDNLKYKNDYLNSMGYLQSKLFMLFRHTIIKRIRKELVDPSRLYRLLYLVKLSIMHKEVKEARFGREVIRKWRFMCFLRKMAKRKMETIYLNLHSNFIQMTNEVFGEKDDINPSLIKEFEFFGEDIGMFTNEPIQENVNNENLLCKNISRQYMFDAELMTKEIQGPVVYKEINISEATDRNINIRNNNNNNSTNTKAAIQMVEENDDPAEEEEEDDRQEENERVEEETD